MNKSKEKLKPRERDDGAVPKKIELVPKGQSHNDEFSHLDGGIFHNRLPREKPYKSRREKRQIKKEI